MSLSSQSNILNHQCTTINYRNAIYQGHLAYQTIRSGYGIVYIANTHQFIVCSNWLNDQINQNCIFFNNDDRYCYGEWLDNKPHGLNVIRVGEISLVAQFVQGKIQKGNKILINYQKYSVAAIFIVKKDITFLKGKQQNDQNFSSFNNQEEPIDIQTLELYVKKELLSKQELKELYVMCGWSVQDYDQFQSLIRFMYSKMNYDYQTNKGKKVKLRLINNIYYRFGYDHGLAIVFNDQYKRISVGYHDKSRLCSYGALFTQSTLGTETQEGIFNDQQQIFVFSNQSRPQAKIGKIYSTNLLMGINFINKFYQNPSNFYLNKIQNFLHTSLLKSMVSGYITTRRILQNFESEQISKQSQSKNLKQITPQKQNLKFHATNGSNANDNQNIKPINQIQQQKKRLQAIKKQIYNSIQRRKSQAIKERVDRNVSQQNSRIINYQQVGTKSKISFSQPQIFLKTPQKTEKSKSKKKIFKQLKNGQWVPSQFSPQEIKSSSLTPFKQKMKHRIFQNKEIEKDKLQVPKKSPKSTISNKHPHSSYKVPINIQQHNSKQSISQYQSPYQKFNASQNQQTKIKVHYPVTNLHPSKSKLRINQSESPHVNSYMQNDSKQERQERVFPKSQYVRIDERELQQISAKKKSLKDKANQQKLIKVLQDIEQQTSSKGKPSINAYEPIFIEKNKNSHKKDQQIYSNQKRKNQIYLIQPKQQRSKSRNKNNPYNKRYESIEKDNYQNQIQRSSNSYTSKHLKKKQIQKQIQKSPDRYRCYGNNLNNINVSQTKSKSKTSIRQNDPYTKGNYPQISNNRHSQYKNSQFQYHKMF